MSGEGGDEAGGSTRARPRALRRPWLRWLAGAAGAGLVVAVIVLAIVSRDDGGGDDGGGDDGGGGDGPGDTGGAERLDVAIVGDSLIEQSRDQFRAHAEAAGLTVEAVAFGGSAPCDWMDDFERFAEARPRHLIISFAGNDNTPCINPAGGGFRDPATIARAYADMMPGIVELFAGTGTEVHVALPPPMGPPASEPAAAAIRATYRDLADARDDVTLVDPAPLLGPDGEFDRTLPCEEWEAAACAPDGTVTLRNADGIHLTPEGGERYARVLLEAVGAPVE
jgi:lysophospholipase L1-like esterase